jgi:hypothetical protein
MALFNVGLVIFPDLTQLDFTGAQQVLRDCRTPPCHIVARTLDPGPSDSGLSLMPTHTFANCPPLDLICRRLPGHDPGHGGPRPDRVRLAAGTDGEICDLLFAQGPSFWGGRVAERPLGDARPPQDWQAAGLQRQSSVKWMYTGIWSD